ncbi:uncharacterized protein PV06_05429 [Exophiala oligosperma]|uniref:Uncharacterized protein n=1 Tax=Exophiala oligosperma TaxID=215243 RepID=A0A0D2BWG7_9EURO|nr:uncharacterized protein PV06_05429 [Exophiala oligosperma]KIW41822.1 hypothetical protein PV06_05429 [Exophiala oligosperma]
MAAVKHLSSLSNRVAIVTGGSSGLGRAVVQAFAAAGAHVVSADLSPKPPVTPILEKRYKETDFHTPTVELANTNWPSNIDGRPRAIFQKCDVTKEADVEATVQQAVKSYGRLDILVNNAGTYSIAIFHGIAPELTTGPVRIHDQEVSVLDRVLSVNARGTWLGVKHSVKQMLSQQPDVNGIRGRIVNVGSILSRVGAVGSTCYCSSKGSITQLTRAAALEYARDGIPINSVLPGYMESNMVEGLYRDNGEDAITTLIGEMCPVGRVGRAEEVAQAVVYLSGDQASYMTGVELPVDGGFLIR